MMGWFSDNVHRMVGIPRMRQLRAKFGRFLIFLMSNKSHVYSAHSKNYNFIIILLNKIVKPGVNQPITFNT